MKRLINSLLRHERIDGGGACPVYLYRWTLFGLGSWLKIYLHHFVGDDWALDPHDHPKRFISIGLWGWYIEDVYSQSGNMVDTRLYEAPWIRSFPSTHIHRIRAKTHGNVWTIAIVLHHTKPWGFIQDGKWIPWYRYTFGGIAKKSC